MDGAKDAELISLFSSAINYIWTNHTIDNKVILKLVSNPDGSYSMPTSGFATLNGLLLTGITYLATHDTANRDHWVNIGDAYFEKILTDSAAEAFSAKQVVQAYGQTWPWVQFRRNSTPSGMVIDIPPGTTKLHLDFK